MPQPPHEWTAYAREMEMLAKKKAQGNALTEARVEGKIQNTTKGRLGRHSQRGEVSLCLGSVTDRCLYLFGISPRPDFCSLALFKILISSAHSPFPIYLNSSLLSALLFVYFFEFHHVENLFGCLSEIKMSSRLSSFGYAMWHLWQPKEAGSLDSDPGLGARFRSVSLSQMACSSLNVVNSNKIRCGDKTHQWHQATNIFGKTRRNEANEFLVGIGGRRGSIGMCVKKWIYKYMYLYFCGETEK